MDGGAWQAKVHGVVKSWRQLSDFYLYTEKLKSNMDNQQGPTYCIAHESLLYIMWHPGWEGSLGENGYMCMHG